MLLMPFMVPAPLTTVNVPVEFHLHQNQFPEFVNGYGLISVFRPHRVLRGLGAKNGKKDTDRTRGMALTRGWG